MHDLHDPHDIATPPLGLAQSIATSIADGRSFIANHTTQMTLGLFYTLSRNCFCSSKPVPHVDSIGLGVPYGPRREARTHELPSTI